MELVLTYIGYGLLAIGAFFMLVSSLGLIRMPDFYNRMQAATKASTLGSMSIIMGVGFLHPDCLFKCFLMTAFILITNPLSSSVLARASYRAGVPMCGESVLDQCKCLKDKREVEG